MSTLRIPIGPKDHVQGNPETAKIVLVEYGDYQCPYCGHAFPLVKKFVEEYPDDVAFVFRNFPLTDSHEYAMSAAAIAEASGNQGKFWEMHDLIYDNQDLLNEGLLKECVKVLQLDVNKIENDISTSEIQDKIEADFEGGVRSGVNGTPSFFVNDQKWEDYDGTYDCFIDLLS
ncbi:thioredoxin domain-containing protein [Chryseobacterium sp. ERMR1:04]|uniref:DsbA family protein n=1 Tax=Chryseobacterium sp. ERMR1:04 TaxID=1705393 RepID=UPI0006C85A8B|nr:thioredoxin domain-containing protein [Chryseobacterium sp. ERMR1:04]KPH12239.1 disulfide bond formation protein DsbA [Chryseobacterium sp. ERMR1:04]